MECLGTWDQGTPEKLRLEPTPEQLQRCGRPHLFGQAVPKTRPGATAAKARSPIVER